ncbi:MAG: phenylacetate--CoA ligase family protein, partial [Deltaproteobacteria bacterium]|nr:phenylacetate--CoA ligase family protein [Deltaproteobacteria bacterium]
DALDWTAAVNFFVREWAAKAPFASEAHLSTSPGGSLPGRDRAREWVKCASLNRTNLPIAGWDSETLERLRRDLARVRPTLVQGHPSTLHALAHHIRETGGLSRPLFGVFESTGETLDPGTRKTIEEIFGCTVVDRYGSAEFGVVAYERPGGRAGMEILEAVVFAETLPNEEGREELVLTGLLNEAMPLLRYRTGDLVRLACESDEVAGRIVEIQGRVHDAIEISGRRVPTHVIQDRLDRLGCIEEFQIEIEGDRPPRLRIAAPDGEQDRIRSGIAEWWGDAFEVEFASRERFVRTGWRGKFHHRVVRGAPDTRVVRGSPDTTPKGDA